MTARRSGIAHSIVDAAGELLGGYTMDSAILRRGASQSTYDNPATSTQLIARISCASCVVRLEGD